MPIPTWSIAVSDKNVAYTQIKYTRGTERTGVPPGFSLLSEDYMAAYMADNRLATVKAALEHMGVTDARAIDEY